MADYIDREKAEKIIQSITIVDVTSAAYAEAVLFIIRNIPSADVAPVVHGKWVYNKNATDWGIGGYVCSECQNKNNNLPCNRVKSVRMFSGAKYCPECGTKMDMEQEEPTNEKQHDAE